MEGLDEYRHGNEFQWAVNTALAPANEGCCSLFDHTAEQFVEDAFPFIVAAFEGEGFEPPHKGKLIEAVRKEQSAAALDWIFCNVLESGEKLRGQRITDEQWNEICRIMHSARITPPSRTKIDKYIEKPGLSGAH